MKRYIVAALAVCMISIFTGCGQAADAVQGQEISEEEASEAAKETGAVSAQTEETIQNKDEVQKPGTDEPEAAADGVQEPGTDEPEAAADEVQEPQTDETAGDVSEEDVLEVPTGGRRLTTEELQEYTEWVQDISNYGFLLSDWEDPTQIDLYEVFYCGAGIARQGTDEEKQAFLERYDQSEIYTDFLARDRSAVDDFLLDKVGLSYEEILARGSEGMELDYFAETDSFCTEAGDTNYCQFICTDGVVNEEGTVVTLLCDGDDWIRTCEVKVLTAEDHKGFLSNHILEGRILDREEASGEE